MDTQREQSQPSAPLRKLALRWEKRLPMNRRTNIAHGVAVMKKERPEG